MPEEPDEIPPDILSRIPLFREMSRILSSGEGPINWELARQAAVAVAASGEDGSGEIPGDPAAVAAGYQEPLRLAELWLADTSTLAAVSPLGVHPVSRTDWVESIIPGFRPLADPLAARVVDGISGIELVNEQVRPALTTFVSVLFGMQVGTALGHLARAVLAQYDLGLPAADPHHLVPVEANIAAFVREYEIDPLEFRIWLAGHELMHDRVLDGVPWMRGYLQGLVARFARGMQADPAQLSQQLGSLDPANPASLQEALANPEILNMLRTPEQDAALEQLETTLSLVQGYVDLGLETGLATRLPSSSRIAEAMRRRRAEKGPGEQIFEQLVGLDLTAAVYREGLAFCRAVVQAQDIEGLDRIWALPDNLPTAGEMDDPPRWLIRMELARAGG
ncbi:MAG: zinc-dependent metalloprotease [Actinomycetota bacterium]